MSEELINRFSMVHPLIKAAPLKGEYRVPGDKSISHRALILPAACQRRVRITGFNTGHDVMATRNALAAVGVVFKDEGDALLLSPPAIFQCAPQTVIDMGNSGTSARLLLGLFASLPNLTLTMTGDASLIKRPMRRVVEPLRAMGASIELMNDKTLPAVCNALSVNNSLVKTNQLHGIMYAMPVASAQLKSALLIAGLRALTPITIIEPLPSRDHTENMLRLLGVDLVSEGQYITINPLSAEFANNQDDMSIHVPGDPSAAAFWCVAALCCTGSSITIKGINGNSYRTEFVKVLQQMGGQIIVECVGQSVGEPLWNLTVHASPLMAVRTAAHQSPALMDEFPILAVAAALADGETIFEGLSELRVKESDRLHKIEELLRLFGCAVEAGDDYLRIIGKTIVTSGDPIHYDPALDHRMAMSALILARAVNRAIVIENVDCIATSFPTFLVDFNSSVMNK